MRRLFGAIALFGCLGAAQGAPAPAGPTVSFDEVRTGALLMKSAVPGRHWELPRVATDIAAEVSGGLVRTTVTQRFVNPSGHHVEATYVWPTPEGAAVDILRLQIGERVIEGEIQEKAEARAAYEAAARSGRRAGLLERHRPNLFTTAVANIGPGESVIVQIAYQDWLAPRDGAYRLRIPTAVAPRYEPPADGPNLLHHAGWDGEAARAPTPQPLIPTPAAMGGDLIAPLTISVELAAGFPLGAVTSSYHEVAVTGEGDARAIRTLGAVESDRDFELVWRSEPGTTVAPALFHEKARSAHHYLLTLHPGDAAAGAGPARDLTLVLDVSGSMAGASIRQAKAALRRALQSLTPRDRFAVVTFQSQVERYALTLTDATADAVADALRFVDAIDANGGTEMAPALKAAFETAAPKRAGRLSQMVLITDAAIGQEGPLLERIARDRGAARLFTVGIGSAANGHFIERAARLGGGAAITIGDIGEVAARMDRLITKLTSPAMTDLAIEGLGGADIHPRTLPDLYAGEPLTLSVRSDRRLDDPILISGVRNGRRAVRRLDPAAARPGPGAAKVWADRAIRSWEEDVARGLLPHASTEARILLTALDYGLVTRLTSLVAVEKDRIARAADDPLHVLQASNAPPAGWRLDKVFGPDADRRETAMRARWAASPAGRAVAAQADAASPASPIVDGAAMRLPQGGLDLDGRSLGALVLAGLAFWLLRGRPVRRRDGLTWEDGVWRG